MLGQDIAILLKICLLEGPKILSKKLADELFLSTAEVSKSLNRCKDSGLLYWSDLEKRVNRSALLDFLAYGMRYVFPPQRGALVRGVPTASAGRTPEVALPGRRGTASGLAVPRRVRPRVILFAPV
jgi:hypothetical protein